MREINGFTEEYFILGRLYEKEYIDANGKITSNPLDAMRFNNYGEAREYYVSHESCYNYKFYPHNVKLTFEFI